MGEITRGEQLAIDDANEFVRQSANLQSEIPETSGIRPHPLVESTEQTLDTSRFGFGFGPKPLAESLPGIPSGTTGACCYNDGTCDDLTESDCTSAGGNYQGDGTNCTEGLCVGACCEGAGDHTCVPNSTPDSCAADGGIFHDFQTTCSPSPCGATGACCNVDHTCSIRTEAECIGLSGTYLGDGVPCDPNPCGGGACCVYGVCSNQPNSGACLDLGGVYFGDGSTCSGPVADECNNAGCCFCPGENCVYTTFSDCLDPCTFTGGQHFCCDGGGGLGTSICCDGSSPAFQHCCGYDNDTGASWCCDDGYTCCGGFAPNQCCNSATEQCTHPIDPESGLPGSFCCPIDWIPCGFVPCCDPDTEHCCESGGVSICLAIGTPCP